jgi:hypothetical protein
VMTRQGKCHICGGELWLGSCPHCAERAANEPEFAATEGGQWALAANARVCAIARRAAQRPIEWTGDTERAARAALREGLA